MNFLNPMMLWGLLAVSIPILIHLFNLRKTKKIEFSTLIFLQEIQQTKYKRIKLLQLLILLCRIGFITFIVLAFAKPVFKGYIIDGLANQGGSLLFILDDSYSMQIRNEDGSYFENAKRKLLSAVEILSKDNEIFFTTVSGINNMKSDFLFSDINTLKDTIEKTEISYTRRNWQDIDYFSSKILENSSNNTKEIYFFTDGQKNIYDGSVVSESEKTSDNNISVVLSGNREGNNLVFDSIDIKTKIFEPGREIKLSANIHNSNKFDVAAKSILLNFNQSQFTDEKVTNIPAGSAIEIEFNINPSVTGFIGGYIELSNNDRNEDEITFDNRRYFTVYIPERIKLLTVSDSEQDMKYIDLVISSVKDIYEISQEKENYIQNLKRFKNFRDISLEEYDCIIINNIKSISEEESVKLIEYVTKGGGVIIYPGVQTSFEDYNKIVFSKLNNLYYNSTFGNLNGTEVFKFENINHNTPLIENIFRNAPSFRMIIENSPLIKFGFDIVTGFNSYSVIGLNNQKNFLTETKTGKGIILMYAVSPDMKFSNFAETNLFAPLTIRSILYSSKTPDMKEATCGKDYFLEIRGNEDDTLFLKSLSAEKIIEMFNYTTPVFINLRNDLNTIGNYSISKNEVTKQIFACNFDNKESELTKLSADEIDKIFKENFRTDVNIISYNDSIEKSLKDIREGSELWKYFLIIALLFLSSEYVLSKYLMKKPKEAKR